MIKLFFRLFALALAVVVSLGVIIAVANSGRATGYNSYIASIIDKQKRLETTPSPKIIFIGGSNLMMGLDSPRVEQALGLPVVNMGVNAGFGLRFMLNQVKPNIGRGDVIIIVPEYEQFYGHLNGNTTLIEALTVFPQGILLLDSAEQYAMIASEFPGFAQGMVTSFFRNLSPREGFIATRQSFNAYGDIITHLNAKSLDVSDHVLLAENERVMNNETIPVLNEFGALAARAGARVFVMFPPIPDKQARENRTQIDDVSARLQRQATATILGTPSDFVFPLNYFFDTVYHLNQTGRDARTQRVIEMLKPVMR